MRFALASSALATSCVLVAGYASPARADTIDPATRATARQLGEEGMHAYDGGDFAIAADKLSRAHALVHVPTLAYYAGKCLEKLGRLVEAEEKYVDAMHDPVEQGAPATMKAARADAEKARNALLPRLPSVVLTVQPPIPDAQVVMDGKDYPPPMIGVKRFVDPGTHTVQVLRLGGVTTKQFTVQEGEATTLEVPVPPPAQPGGSYPYPYYAPPYGGRRGPVAVYQPTPAVPMRRNNMGLFVSGCVLAPVGAVVAIAGLGLFAFSNAETGGSSGGGIAMIAVGLAGMGGGIAMAVIGGKKVPVETPAAPAVSFEPLLGPTSAGLRVRF